MVTIKQFTENNDGSNVKLLFEALEKDTSIEHKIGKITGGGRYMLVHSTLALSAAYEIMGKIHFRQSERISIENFLSKYPLIMLVINGSNIHKQSDKSDG